MSVRSLATLLQRADIEDHDEVLRAANAELKQNKNDLNTQHVKVVALLKLDRWDDAIKTIEDAGDKLKDQARLEYAYALYKAGKPSEAATVAADGEERGLRHVEAQASYRIEDFAKASELYQRLAADLDEDAEADLRINSGATDAQLEWSGSGDLVTKKKPERADLEAFETAYNAACGSIARGELGQGEVLLKRARDLCNALEDLSPEDKEAELVPITIQQVYVLARLGKEDEARNLAQSIEATDISDASTKHIAKVNSAAVASGSHNSFLAQRLVSGDLESLKPDYPFQFQSAILTRNRYATDLQSLKFSGTAASTSHTIDKTTAPATDATLNTQSVINAAAHAKNHAGKEALKHILPILEKRPNNIGVILTIVQLYFLTGNSWSAIKLLEGFLARLEQSGSAENKDVRFAPGLVGTIASLYQSQGRRTHSQTELAKAATHWRRRSKNHSPGVLQLLKAAGGALADSNVHEYRELAAEIFTDLHNHNPDDRYATAGLVAVAPSNATLDQIKALTPISTLISDVDAAALESAGLAQPTSAPGVTATTRKRPAEDTKPKKAKKIRPSRMPKDYDPSKTPDPERWLPLRDRSTYRPKGKKGKARANLLSQGAAPAGDSDGSRPATPGGEVVKGKGQSGGGGGGSGAKKKKAKGKR